ncbi:ribbon-helix-helix domain-containing protein [Maribacter sp. X9]|uniref:ribbon-helix-helix domain-containing protein n=1 Tax=Maribacter sp. X9 TaxID=3402159 RepID=UPI003AF33E9B
MKSTINLRIEEDLKISLQEMADDSGVSLSDHIRDILLKHLDNFIEEIPEPYEEEEDFDDLDYFTPTPFERTFEFTHLLTWLFCRQLHPQDNNSKIVLQGFKIKVEKVLAESTFSNELKLEFLKVLGDLNRIIIEPDYENKQFLFPVMGNHLSFNYYLLINEIWSLKTTML